MGNEGGVAELHHPFKHASPNLQGGWSIPHRFASGEPINPSTNIVVERYKPTSISIIKRPVKERTAFKICAGIFSSDNGPQYCLRTTIDGPFRCFAELGSYRFTSSSSLSR